MKKEKDSNFNFEIKKLINGFVVSFEKDYKTVIELFAADRKTAVEQAKVLFDQHCK